MVYIYVIIALSAKYMVHIYICTYRSLALALKSLPFVRCLIEGVGLRIEGVGCRV